MYQFDTKCNSTTADLLRVASRPNRLIDQGAPVLTVLEQVLSLLKLLPLQLAAKDGSAVPRYSIGEVLTVHTDQTGDVWSREVCPA